MRPRIVTEIVMRPLVIMTALEPFPPVESQPTLRRHERISPLPVDMPLTDVRRPVPGLAETLGEKRSVVPLIQALVIHHQPVTMRVDAGQQRAAVRGTDRATGDRVGEAQVLAGKPVDVWRLDVRVTGITERLRAPLVGEDEQQVGWTGHRFTQRSRW